MTGPCAPYITGQQVHADPDLCAVAPETAPPDWDAYALGASQVLYRLTAMAFPGVCTATVRPVWRGYTDTLLGSVYGCSPAAVLPLHDPMYVVAPSGDDDGYPVTVKIDGDEFTDFYVRDGNSIVRSDGRSWPCTNRLHLADTETGTFSVTYSFGGPAPQLVADAALELAVEYAKGDLAPAKTKLPPGTTSWNRGGFSGGIDPEAAKIRESGTSLPTVARAIGTFNPGNHRMPSMVSQPDRHWDLVVVG